jgi:antitoxin component YwqK of YwqJK toxin-antitoxin module
MKTTYKNIASILCLVVFGSFVNREQTPSPYTSYHQNGVPKFSVEYRKSRLTGQWQSWYPSGKVCDSGRFVGNAPDGIWKGWYADGSLRYSWHTSAAKLGSLKDELLRQPKTKFFLIAQKPVGEAVRYFQVEYLFRNKADKPKVFSRGQLLRKKADLTLIEQTVDNNTTSKGTDYVPPFDEILLHGECSLYYPGGALKERGMYINGLRDGVWEEFAPSGEMSRGAYLHGNRSGEWRRYDKDGKLLFYTHYKQNGEVSESYQFNQRR